MKKIFTFILTAISFHFSFSQDIITKKDGVDIKAKVMEVSATEVRYKKFENLNGPVYSLAITEIYMVKYENGEKDLFDQKTDAQKNIIGSGNTADLNQKPVVVSNTKFSIGTNSGILLPVSNFSSLAKTGAAFAVKGEYALTKKSALGFSLGYYAIAGKSVNSSGINIALISQFTTTNNSYAIIPVIVEYKHYFFIRGNFMPYASIGLGYYSMDVSGSVKNDFGVVPKIGFLKGDKIKWGISLDLTIASGDYSKVSFVGISTGLMMPLGK
jgi:hypothetical protein